VATHCAASWHPVTSPSVTELLAHARTLTSEISSEDTFDAHNPFRYLIGLSCRAETVHLALILFLKFLITNYSGSRFTTAPAGPESGHQAWQNITDCTVRGSYSCGFSLAPAWLEAPRLEPPPRRCGATAYCSCFEPAAAADMYNSAARDALKPRFLNELGVEVRLRRHRFGILHAWADMR
jgi:hypothetical protein